MIDAPLVVGIAGTGVTVAAVLIEGRRSRGISEQITSAQGERWHAAFGRLVDLIENGVVAGTINEPGRLRQLAVAIAAEHVVPAESLNTFAAVNAVALRISESKHLGAADKEAHLQALDRLLRIPEVRMFDDRLVAMVDLANSGNIDAARDELQKLLAEHFTAITADMQKRNQANTASGRPVLILGTLIPVALALSLSTAWFALLEQVHPTAVWLGYGLLPLGLAWGLSIVLVAPFAGWLWRRAARRIGVIP